MIPLLLALNTGACQPEGTGGGSAGSVPAFELQREMYIDGWDYDLITVKGIAPRYDGVVAVLDWRDQRVRFFEANGSLLSVVGREGEGPGEFANATNIGWLADSLWVSDTGLKRVTFVGPDTVFRTLDVRGEAYWQPDASAPEAYSFFAEHMLRDGSFLASIYMSSTPSSTLLDDQSQLLSRVQRDCASCRWIIGHNLSRIPAIEHAVGQLSRGGSIAVAPPFANNVVRVISPDGCSVAVLEGSAKGPEAGSVQVTLLSSRGDTIYHRRLALPPEPIPRHVADSALDAYAKRARIAQDPGEAETIRSAAYVPDIYPPIVDALLGVDGRLWILGRPRSRGSWWILDPMGHLTGRVSLPGGRAAIKAADASHIWTAEYDDYDVPSVVRYRIRPPDQLRGSEDY